MKNLWEKGLMLIAFTQICFSIYKFDSEILVLPPVHAQKCGVWLMCGEQIVSICFILFVQIQEGGKYHSTALTSCCAINKYLMFYKECKSPTEVKKWLIHMSGSRIQLPEVKRLVFTCSFNSEVHFKLIFYTNHEFRAMCFIKKAVFQPQSAIQMESPKKLPRMTRT